ncbi:hypothetical protein AK812_SmicGene19061 [Symbiodinium microadriaticum]|uniref:EF-hand domain-containing protein n=1 Tax=Symbiodinium microadriaticum TaxID=2951 RepID=A0A1Q9DTJ3_SYMMI|nr:hypothetical protein AK812_SmicGene19061 [Symbiodinium microadriaticum]
MFLADAAHDRSNNGYISRADFLDALEHIFLNAGHTPEEVDEIADRFTLGAGDTLSYEEFCDIVGSAEADPYTETMESAEVEKEDRSSRARVEAVQLGINSFRQICDRRYASMRESFRALDKSRRSSLSPQEFAHGLSMHGINFQPAELQARPSKRMACRLPVGRSGPASGNVENSVPMEAEGLRTPTPRGRCCSTPRTPAAPRPAAVPMMMKVLGANTSSEKKLKSLEAMLVFEPEAATSPFEDHEFETPLAFAVKCGVCDFQVIRLLLRYGADVHGRGACNRTAAEIVAERLVSMASRLLLEPMHRSFLQKVEAARVRDLEVLQVLIDAGADVPWPGSRFRLGDVPIRDAKLIKEFWICFFCAWVQTAAYVASSSNSKSLGPQTCPRP